MNELIKVSLNETREPVVSGRELHEFLEIPTRYNDWFSRMCEYGFVENQDYVAITQKRVTAQGNETTFTDHAITLDMAKEIAMIQRTEKGKQARRYFIKCEKRLKEGTINLETKIKVLLKVARLAPSKEIKNQALLDVMELLYPGRSLTTIEPTIINNNSVSEYLKQYNIYSRETGEVYKEYRKFCKDNKLNVLTKSEFHKETNHLTGLKAKQIRLNGERPYIFSN